MIIIAYMSRFHSALIISSRRHSVDSVTVAETEAYKAMQLR